jgi:hypothetical protein
MLYVAKLGLSEAWGKGGTSFLERLGLSEAWGKWGTSFLERLLSEACGCGVREIGGLHCLKTGFPKPGIQECE